MKRAMRILLTKVDSLSRFIGNYLSEFHVAKEIKL